MTSGAAHVVVPPEQDPATTATKAAASSALGDSGGAAASSAAAAAANDNNNNGDDDGDAAAAATSNTNDKSNDKSNNDNNNNAAKNGNGGSKKSGSSSSSAAAPTTAVAKRLPPDPTQTTCIWDMPKPVLRKWIDKTCPLVVDLLSSSSSPPRGPSTAAGDKKKESDDAAAAEAAKAAELWNRLELALDSLYEEDRFVDDGGNLIEKKDADDSDDDDEEQDDDEDESGRRKRKKKRKKKRRTVRVLHDPYRLWLQAWKEQERIEQENDDGGGGGGSEAQQQQQQHVGGVGGAPSKPATTTLVLPPEADDVPAAPGGKLAHLTLGGVVNALTPTLGGVVDKLAPKMTAGVPHAAVAMRLHRACQTRVHADILRTTPLRIQDMLASDLTKGELQAIRKRVYDTVILGKGMHANEDNDEDDLVVASSGSGAASSSQESFKKCPVCNNNDQSSFVMDRKNGDIICSNCGTVVSESIMHEGSAYRKFEGEADRNHHGDAANPLYSNAHNMGTTLGGGNMQPVRGMATGAGKRNNLETILRNAHAYIELNVSQFGKTDRRTRVGYKDKQKKEAFVQMAHVGDALNLHEAVVQRAKELFAGFRDDRELVQQFKGVIGTCLLDGGGLCRCIIRGGGIFCRPSRCLLSRQLLIFPWLTYTRPVDKLVLLDDTHRLFISVVTLVRCSAACLCEAFEQLSQEGKAILKGEEQAEANATGGGTAETGGAEGGSSSRAARVISARAARRNELHHANLAGKGGLLIDFLAVDKDPTKPVAAEVASTPGGGSTTPSAAASPKVTEKPAAAWDLLDCRSWLLDASRRIAQQWVDERNKSEIAPAIKKNIPEGSLEELEGRLVEHSISLCEQLEAELQARGNAGNGGAKVVKANGKRVITPRVQDMSKLGIKWQHSHERGSGGRGGVGGSGQGQKKVGAGIVPARPGGGGGGRTAGQILILKTSKKLGAILNDPVAGEAFHKELKRQLDSEEVRKRLLVREEASRQRLQQMKRKPWLQARIQG